MVAIIQQNEIIERIKPIGGLKVSIVPNMEYLNTIIILEVPSPELN